jgi:uncharacterized membrane protein
MESHAKAAGHAIHQQLIVFPLGLLATAVVFDIVRLIVGRSGFAVASYYMIAAGVLSGVVAAVFGAIDYLAIPGGTRAKRVGLLHGAGNVVVVVLFAVSWLLREGQPRHAPTAAAFILALLGGLIALGTGWLGGELVGRLGVGVEPDANLNVPASYTTRIRLARAPTAEETATGGRD